MINIPFSDTHKNVMLNFAGNFLFYGKNKNEVPFQRSRFNVKSRLD